MGECYFLHRRVDASGPDAGWLESLRAALAEAGGHRYCEIRIDHGDFPALRALVNGGRATLFHVAGPTDPGSLSRDPDSEGDLEEDEEVDYLTSGGEWDSYPSGLSLPSAEVFRILEWFATHPARPESVAWYGGPAGSEED